eukprot:jgi/Mesvir1/25761/Mv01938-RA.1
MQRGTSKKSTQAVLGSLSDNVKVLSANFGGDFKEVDIAVVKATNHDEVPPKEKHVRTLLSVVGGARPRSDVMYVIQGIHKRMKGSTSWLVVLKSLIVFHRCMREVDPSFAEQLARYASKHSNLLNMANFKDDSSPDAWDYSAWVRTYSLYLEERLECIRSLEFDVENEAASGHSRTREYSTSEILAQLPKLQQLLHRLLGCQPEGASTMNQVILFALALVLKESFKLYRAINDGVINLVDKFFEMERADAMAALEIYKLAAKQADALQSFYESAKTMDIVNRIQFPDLAQSPESFLATMEEYVREAPRVAGSPRASAQIRAQATGQLPPAQPIELSGTRLVVEPKGSPAGGGASSSATRPGQTSLSVPLPGQAKKKPVDDSVDLLGMGNLTVSSSQAAGFGTDGVSALDTNTVDLFGDSNPFAAGQSSLSLPTPAASNPFPASGGGAAADPFFGAAPLTETLDTRGSGAFPQTHTTAQPPQKQPAAAGKAPALDLDSLYSAGAPRAAPSGAGWGYPPPAAAPTNPFGAAYPAPVASTMGGYGTPPVMSQYGAPGGGAYGARTDYAGYMPPAGYGGGVGPGSNPFGAPPPPPPPLDDSNPFGNPFGAPGGSVSLL